MHDDTYSLDLGVTGLTLKAAVIEDGTIDATFRDIDENFFADGAGGYQFSGVGIPDTGIIVFYVGTIGAGTDFSGVTKYASASAEEASSGGGGSGDWTSNEKTAIRAILGVPGSGTTPATPTTGILAAIAAKTGLITVGNVTVVSPVNASGTAIQLFRGDDYHFAHGRHLLFSVTANSPTFPDVAGGSVKLKCAGMTDLPGEIVNSTTIYFEPTSALTAALNGGPFEVEATLADDDVVTIAVGEITMSGQL